MKAVSLAQVKVSHAFDEGRGIQRQRAEIRCEQFDPGIGLEILQGSFQHGQVLQARFFVEQHPRLEQRRRRCIREPAGERLLQQRAAEGIDRLQWREGLTQALCLALAITDQQRQFGALCRAGLVQPLGDLALDQGEMGVKGVGHRQLLRVREQGG